ncbi:MAG TPA: flagellar motor switch protein FliG [Polyangiaceae bacterium]|nr:flagellar motor switch protein FliG [Polyangiaceae bacterium]
MRVSDVMELSGPEKAVLMLLSLDEATATPILSEMDAGDVRKLREAASNMRAVPATALEGVYAEFIQQTKEAVAVPRGGVRYLRKLTGRALGETRAAEIFVDQQESALERLAGAEPSAIASVMENEHPQLVAAILSQLDNEKAARVLEQLPEASRTQVLERLGTMTEIPSALLEEVATALSAELPTSQKDTVRTVDGIARSAALVRRMGRETGEALLGTLEEGNQELATEIRRAMYTFEDLSVLDARALRSLLEAVPVEKLTMAMKTASESLRAHIFTSMSKRAAERIKEDMEVMGGVRLADVEAAQREIVEVALRLDAEGTISLEAKSAVV